jgi:hypothetical protein
MTTSGKMRLCNKFSRLPMIVILAVEVVVVLAVEVVIVDHAIVAHGVHQAIVAHEVHDAVVAQAVYHALLAREVHHADGTVLQNNWMPVCDRLVARSHVAHLRHLHLSVGHALRLQPSY